jgi:glycosyltransferase involved in cell wall biosynthesis
MKHKEISTNHICNKNIIYYDVNTLPHEGFTSGLFILIKEYLERLQKLGHKVNICSLSEDVKNHNTTIEKSLKSLKSNIKIDIKYIDLQFKDLSELKIEEKVKIHITKYSPDIILINNVAVFLKKENIATLKALLQSGANVITLVFDELFPTYDNLYATMDKENIRNYYELINQTKVYCLTERLRKKLYSISGIHSNIIPTLFNNKLISTNSNGGNIAMINTHPVKGVEVFNKIAEQMPELNFMIIKNWQDVPEYFPTTKNITYYDFFHDIKEMYAKIKILLVPSLIPEGTPRVIIESMINKIPIIAHKVPGIYDVFKEGVNFIQPPEIISYVEKDSVLKPVMDLESLDKTTCEFVNKIREILENYDNYSENLEILGQIHIKNSEDQFSSVIYNWLN